MYYVFDVDGTICFNGISIDPSILESLKKLKETHQLVFASARPIRDLLPIVSEFKDCLLIGGNGSIVSENEKIRVMKCIDDSSYSIIKNLSVV